MKSVVMRCVFGKIKAKVCGILSVVAVSDN